ncbi:hypothetical protein [Planktothrix paucivesiculata]|uniref:Uncharacterized protein n=1 Tax=Planktothrix paucivesiculata PCC 9631 TaxID=671071 RepID=A0A7Z9BIY3_9CYAN|nr:hypothetical protein [Planktothrix paucivesiculata]VXD12946.1 hypothetical protein PL9631_1060260 [Planktothrix paucivesiculata PCC 9631]
MIPPHRDTLLQARKLYSQCANKVETTIEAQGLTPLLSTQIIGIGVATEWIRRAAEMDNIHYMGKNLNKSKSSDLFVEILRFNFSWFALNAIFTRRDELLSLFGTPSDGSEYSAFHLLYTSAMPPNAAARLETLHLLLNAPIETRLPIETSLPITSYHSVSTLQAIYRKYLPSNIRGRTARAIQQAVQAGNANSLDMPTLLYGLRNWSVHGNTLHGCFGSHPRFYEYTSLLQETLADIHYDVANTLIGLL